MRRRYGYLISVLSLATLGTSGDPASAQSYGLEPRVGFPDFRFMEPAGTFDGQVFILSDDFPQKLPERDPEVDAILKIDFRTEPLAYAMAVRDYVFKGNIHGGPVAEDFVLQQNSAGNAWYHVPWQHWGPLGREGYHGLTREGPLSPHSLAPTQVAASSAYAVGFYNAQGGYALGQVWPSPDAGPDLATMIAGDGFPEGTVVGKFLFTVLDSTEVPWLADPVQWDAYMYDCDLPETEDCPVNLTGDEAHSTQKVNLLQMDIMVKDSRASEAAGWVFGTFTYNGTLPAGSPYGEACAAIEGPGRNWCNLMPVGVMWGNDPENAETRINWTPTGTVINPALKATWINPDPALPAMHLGFNSRLNGPADNPSSSCMSCHSTAQYPNVSAIMPWLNVPKVDIPEDGSTAPAAWMRWFRDFKDGEAFDPGQAIPLDFSMQLTKSVENYIEYRSKAQGGHYALEYWANKPDYTASRGADMQDAALMD